MFSFCLRHVNQRRRTVQELLFDYWRPSIPYLTIIDLRFLKISWARIASPWMSYLETWSKVYGPSPYLWLQNVSPHIIYFSFNQECWRFGSFGTGSSRIQSFRTNDLFQLPPALSTRPATVKAIASRTVAEIDKATWLEYVSFSTSLTLVLIFIQTPNRVCLPLTGLRHTFLQCSKKGKTLIIIRLSNWYRVGLSLQSMTRIQIFSAYLVPQDLGKAS